jgi:Zn-dependent protease
MGAEIEAGCELIPYRKEILLYLSGPLFNLFGCIVAFFLIRMNFREDFLFFFFCNALLGLFNLLPLPGLDGQRALFAFFCLFLEMHSAFRILSAIELLFLILVGFFSVLLFLTKKNPSLLIFLFWLIFQQRKETSAAKKRAGPAERL